VVVGETLTLYLPGVYDEDEGDSFSYSYDIEKSDGSSPSFVSSDQEGMFMLFEPTQDSEVGKYEITIILSDDNSIGSGSVLSNEYSFELEVEEAPVETVSSDDEELGIVVEGEEDLEEVLLSTSEYLALDDGADP
jgi:hypothetical protein